MHTCALIFSAFTSCAGPPVRYKLTHNLTDAVPIFIHALQSVLPRLAPATVGAFYLRNSSGNFAIFRAIRRASSLLSSSAADRPPRLVLDMDIRERLPVMISHARDGGRLRIFDLHGKPWVNGISR